MCCIVFMHSPLIVMVHMLVLFKCPSWALQCLHTVYINRNPSHKNHVTTASVLPRKNRDLQIQIEPLIGCWSSQAEECVCVCALLHAAYVGRGQCRDTSVIWLLMSWMMSSLTHQPGHHPTPETQTLTHHISLSILQTLLFFILCFMVEDDVSEFHPSFLLYLLNPNVVHCLCSCIVSLSVFFIPFADTQTHTHDWTCKHLHMFHTSLGVNHELVNADICHQSARFFFFPHSVRVCVCLCLCACLPVCMWIIIRILHSAQ